MTRSGPRTRCRRLLAAGSVALAALAFGSGVAVDAAPYVACPGGYIADDLADCPEVPKHPVGGPDVGGGGGGGGVLGDLLDRIGLGGLL